MVYYVRLEYLTPLGWAVGHQGINLVDPQGYVDRLAKREKYGRAIEIDDMFKPTGEVWEPPSLPDPADLVPSDTVIPMLGKARPSPRCPECGREDHKTPFECIL